jgi:hypothetical protein
LTPDRAADLASTRRPRRTSKHRSAQVENPNYAAFATRIIRAHARRIAKGDVEGLVELVDLAGELDAATQTAVDGLRADREVVLVSAAEREAPEQVRYHSIARDLVLTWLRQPRRVDPSLDDLAHRLRLA